MNRMEEIKKEGTNQQKNKEAPKDIDVPPAASNPFVDGFKNSLMVRACVYGSIDCIVQYQLRSY